MLSLSFNASPLFFNAEAAYQTRPFAAAKRHRANNIKITCVEVDAPDRREIEQFIHDVFAHTYGANVQQFMPQLISLRDENNELVAAFGMRKADMEPLFLERYLDAPIETVMSNHFNRVITRHQITEIGNLAVANPRNAGVLIASVIQHSLDINVEWCVATAHHSLQNGLVKGGRDVYALQEADKSRLNATEQATWGRYYDNPPQVVAVRGTAEL
ncbi:thermostable hemolysin [Methylotenera sp. L2L1]|uniref:thermostable hemolysin n=1 Tax=Methylotenera sp. L2L1 TaxID=1502770 RepID=UPI0005639C31|nr:thermostable hemolysin [Methylotenera sp. L2L1]